MRTAYHEALEGTRLDVVRLRRAGRRRHSRLRSRRSTTAILGRSPRRRGRRCYRRAAPPHRSPLHRVDLAPAAGSRRAARDRGDARNRDRPRAVGDYGVDIAKNAIKLSDHADAPATRSRSTGSPASRTRCCSTRCAPIPSAMRTLASDVIDRDDEVDKLYKRSIKLLQEEMQADPDIVRPGTRYLFVLASTRARRRPRRQHRLAYEGHDRRRVSTAAPPRANLP